MSIDPLLAYRERFPILDRTCYLISNSLGAVPAAVEDSLREYYGLWAERGVRAWEDRWWTMVAELGDLVAPLIGAGPGEVVFQPNVTLAHAVILSALDFAPPRRKIVTDAMHFPSILYLLQEQIRRGAELVIVPCQDGMSIDAGRVIEAIDEQTAVVAISHVLFRSAFIQDVESIAAAGRARGALLIVDGYQAVGVIPVNVHALGAHAYIGGCLKWLCGGPGAAFSWVDPTIRGRLEPALTGWMAHQNPFAFDPTLARRSDAWRFLHGTPSIASLYAARPGLEIVNQIGVPAIRARSLHQTNRLLELADQAALRCTTPRDPARRGGTVAIDIENGLEIAQGLKSLGIFCDYRPGAGIRLSPHFYNRDDELDQAIAALLEIQASGAWRAFSARTSAVT